MYPPVLKLKIEEVSLSATPPLDTAAADAAADDDDTLCSVISDLFIVDEEDFS